LAFEGKKALAAEHQVLYESKEVSVEVSPELDSVV